MNASYSVCFMRNAKTIKLSRWGLKFHWIPSTVHLLGSECIPLLNGANPDKNVWHLTTVMKISFYSKKKVNAYAKITRDGLATCNKLKSLKYAFGLCTHYLDPTFCGEPVAAWG